MATDQEFLQNLQDFVAAKLTSKDNEIASLKTKITRLNGIIAEERKSWNTQISRLNGILAEEMKSCNKKDQEISKLKKLLQSKSQQIQIKKESKCYKTKDVPSAIQEKICHEKKHIPKVAFLRRIKTFMNTD